MNNSVLFDEKSNLLFENLAWMTSEEAARFLRISVGSLRNYVWKGELPFYRFKRRLRFKKSDLEKLLQASRNGGY